MKHLGLTNGTQHGHDMWSPLAVSRPPLDGKDQLMPAREDSQKSSPQWSPTTKLLVGIVFVVMAAVLIRQYQFLLGPILASFVLVYLLYTPSRFISQRTRLSWSGAVNVVFLAVLLAAIVILSFLGVTAADQGVRLGSAVRVFADDLPEVIDSLPTRIHVLTFDIDLAALPIYDALQSLSGNLGQAVSTSVDLFAGLVTGVITLIALGFFVLVITYFILQSAGENAGADLLNIDLPDKGHAYDLRRLRRELSRIWRAYLGGQVTLSVVTFFAYLLSLSLLGVQEALGLSILAALARFLPYVGAAITWSVTAVIVLFQGGNYLGLEPWVHVLVVLAVIIVVDQALDQYLMPKVMSNALGVHPAAVMVAVLGAAKLLGPVGLVLAAPVLASGWLVTRYGGRKMLDMDPWPEPEPDAEASMSLWTRASDRIRRSRGAGT
jgi:predicted PurR-regulated permease PerM